MSTNTNDLFGILLDEDKLDGTNYPMWAYMMKHALAVKNLWLYLCGDEERLPNVVTFASSSQIGGNGDSEASFGDSSHASIAQQVHPTRNNFVGMHVMPKHML